MDWTLIQANLLSPPVLFFALGLIAALIGSDLEIPRSVTRGLSLYLLFSIGMHGGVELRESGFSLDAIKALVAGMGASAILPIAIFLLLKRKLSTEDAAAIGATYGSISAVTFITACSFLDDRGLAWSGNMVAAMALMESPAILVAVLLARRASATPRDPQSNHGMIKEALTNGPVFLLLGSLAIGMLVGKPGWASVAPFAEAPFKGVLCLFLLDMGLIAARRLSVLREAARVLLLFALAAPVAQATIAIAIARALDLDPGNALLFTVLCASASYIAVPAAMSSALPRSNPSLYLPMALAVTFPFNIAVGIPLYMSTIDTLWGA